MTGFFQPEQFFFRGAQMVVDISGAFGPDGVFATLLDEQGRAVDAGQIQFDQFDKIKQTRQTG